MNDQSQIMNPPPVVLHHGQVLNQPPHAMVNQPQLLSGSQVINQPQLLGQPQVLNQYPQLMGQPQMLHQTQVPLMNRSYGPWPQQNQQLPPLEPNKKFHGSMNAGFGASMPGRRNWKGKNVNDKRQGPRKVQTSMPNTASSGAGIGGGYNPPALHDLQSQNRMQARKFYPKKKFNNRFAPYAPRNTSSFLIRAKKSGGIASMVSPCPVTPAVLPTPVFSPSREVLVDMAKEEWGVDGYGSMKGLIRLRGEFDNREHEDDDVDDHDHEEENNESSESDVEEEDDNVLSRLDHEMSRFEMVYPTQGVDYNHMLENRVHDQDSHIAQLEEENLTLKENLFLMERELEDLRRRLQILERRNHVSEDVHEEVVENGSECESEGGSYVHAIGAESKEEVMEYVSSDLVGVNADVDSDVKESDGIRDANTEENCLPESTGKADNKNEEVRVELVLDEVDVNKGEHEEKDGRNLQVQNNSGGGDVPH